MESDDGCGGGLAADIDDMYILASARDAKDFKRQWDRSLAALFPVCDDGQRRNTVLAEVWVTQRRRAGRHSEGGRLGAARRYGGTGGLQSVDLQMGTPSVNKSLRASTSTSSNEEKVTDEPTGVSQEAARATQAREEAATVWLAGLPRAEADRVRGELKQRMGMPPGYDLRTLTTVAAGMRRSLLSDIHKEAMNVDD